MPSLQLRTATDVLTFDVETGRLLELAPLDDPEALLCVTRQDHPAFVLQYLAEGAYQTLDSRRAT